MVADPALPLDSAAQPRLARYKPWFYAAAAYNFFWGTVNVLFPEAFFHLISMPVPDVMPPWQVIGMFVLVFAPGYNWVARHPERNYPFAIIGLLGKVLGPIGFAMSVATGQLPLAFGLTILTNDLIWWPAFALYLRDVAAARGGWRRLLDGA